MICCSISAESRFRVVKYECAPLISRLRVFRSSHRSSILASIVSRISGLYTSPDRSNLSSLSSGRHTCDVPSIMSMIRSSRNRKFSEAWESTIQYQTANAYNSRPRILPFLYVVARCAWFQDCRAHRILGARQVSLFSQIRRF
jgi:hypothetical protein